MKKLFVTITIVVIGVILTLVFNIEDNTDTAQAPVSFCHIDTANGLIHYYPQYSSIELAVGAMPTQEDSTVLWCSAAAFTATDEKSVEGSHIINGKICAGDPCSENTGTFVYYDCKWQFHNDTTRVRDAENHSDGMGFSQYLLFYNSEFIGDSCWLYNHFSNASAKIYRCLAEKNGKLCIIQSSNDEKFNEFTNKLKTDTIQNAIYLDCGGWVYAWYRNEHGDSITTPLTSTPQPSATNWIVFKK